MRLSMFGFSFLFLLVFCSAALAQECRPSDFTIQDVEKIDFSESIRLAAYSLLEKQSSGSSSSNTSASLPIGGIPFNMSDSEARSYSDYLLEQSGFAFSSDTTSSIVRTALSVAGVDMYKFCVAGQSIRVDIPASAYVEEGFFLTIAWRPNYKAPDAAQLRIRVRNGTVEGERRYETDLDQFKTETVEIEKGDKATQIAIEIDGLSYPEIVIPPLVEAPRFEYVQRRGIAKQPHERVGDRCTDSAYLVSEVGSGAGNEAKSCTLCVTRSRGGFVFPSTAKLDGALSSRGAYAEIVEGGNSLEVCGRFYTNGAGQGSGRFEVYDGAVFTAWEAVPAGN